MFKYTICFIKQGDKILLLNREKPSWMGSWNGVGGKLEDGESALDCVLREVLEETEIKLDNVRFKGLVTWIVDGAYSGGMYAFIAEIPEDFIYETPKKTEEGILDWKKIKWIFHPENTGVASNVPKFLPRMLEDEEIYEHLFVYKEDMLIKYESKPLSLKV